MADPLRRPETGEFVVLDRDWFARQTREAVDTFFLPVTAVVDTIRARVDAAPAGTGRLRPTAVARAEALRRARKLARKRALASRKKP